MNRITAAGIAHFLLTVSFFSFFPLFIWKNNQHILAVAAGLSFFTFIYLGFAALFGSRETVISIMWGNRRKVSDSAAVYGGRFMGLLTLAFIFFILTYGIFHGGGSAAYKHTGR